MNDEELEFQAIVGTKLTPLGWRYDELVKKLEEAAMAQPQTNGQPDYFPAFKLPDNRGKYLKWESMMGARRGTGR